MKPAARPDADLLAWAAALIEREQQAGTFGVVQIHLEAGKIVRARVERNERPPHSDHG